MRFDPTETEIGLLRQAWAYWGVQAQNDQAMEELAETIVAINHMSRGRVPVRKVAEEFGDVIVTVCQILVNEGGIDMVEECVQESFEKLKAKMSKKKGEA